MGHAYFAYVSDEERRRRGRPPMDRACACVEIHVSHIDRHDLKFLDHLSFLFFYRFFHDNRFFNHGAFPFLLGYKIVRFFD